MTERIETMGKDPSLPIKLSPREYIEFARGTLNLDYFSITNKGDRAGEIVIEYPPYWEEKDEVVVQEKKTTKKGPKGEVEKEEVTVEIDCEDDLIRRRYTLYIDQGALCESISVNQTPVRVTNTGETLLVLGRN